MLSNGRLCSLATVQQQNGLNCLHGQTLSHNTGLIRVLLTPVRQSLLAGLNFIKLMHIIPEQLSVNVREAYSASALTASKLACVM